MNEKKLLEDPAIQRLYFEEHLSCRNSMNNVETGFKIFCFHESSLNKIREDVTKKNYLLFFLKGEFHVTNNQYGQDCRVGEMILIPRSSFYEVVASPGAELLTLFFDRPASNCDRILLQTLSEEVKGVEYDFKPLPVIQPLDKYLELLVAGLKNGLNCIYFHDIMHRELFFLLCGFYTKQQIVELFYPIIGKKLTFKDFVIENSSKVRNVTELLKLSHMGKSNFYNKFKEEFGISAKQWMLQQLNNRIFGMLADPEICIKDIVEELGFCSQSQFTFYCKKHLGSTPKQLITALQENMKA